MTTAAFSNGTAAQTGWGDAFAPLRQLAALLPIEDLTDPDLRFPFAADRSPVAASDTGPAGACARALRALHRSAGGHLLLTGRKGVGKTTLVRQLAQLVDSGAAPLIAVCPQTPTVFLPPASGLSRAHPHPLQ